MRHYDETTIELCILKVSEVDPEREEIERYIHECSECWNVYNALTMYYAEVMFTVNEKNQLVPSVSRRLSPQERRGILVHLRKVFRRFSRLTLPSPFVRHGGSYGIHIKP